jgi:hypothetical protein
MKEANMEITQTDSLNIADVYWWIKGYIAGKKESGEIVTFTYRHLESLEKARKLIESNVDE